MKGFYISASGVIQGHDLSGHHGPLVQIWYNRSPWSVDDGDIF